MSAYMNHRARWLAGDDMYRPTFSGVGPFLVVTSNEWKEVLDRREAFSLTCVEVPANV